jgi:hypothetical protein
LQTWSVPHAVPLAVAGAVAVHCDLPWLHVVTPLQHGSGEAQVSPALQVRQLPAWQVASGPQAVSSAVKPPSSQTGPFGVQRVMPTWQTLSVLHGLPPTQLKTQRPLRQTRPVPQA